MHPIPSHRIQPFPSLPPSLGPRLPSPEQGGNSPGSSPGWRMWVGPVLIDDSRPPPPPPAHPPTLRQTATHTARARGGGGCPADSTHHRGGGGGGSSSSSSKATGARGRRRGICRAHTEAAAQKQQPPCRMAPKGEEEQAACQIAHGVWGGGRPQAWGAGACLLCCTHTACCAWAARGRGANARKTAAGESIKTWGLWFAQRPPRHQLPRHPAPPGFADGALTLGLGAAGKKDSKDAQTKAEKVAKVLKKGSWKRTRKPRYSVTFHRPRTLKRTRDPKYSRLRYPDEEVQFAGLSCINLHHLLFDRRVKNRSGWWECICLKSGRTKNRLLYFSVNYLFWSQCTSSPKAW